MSIWLLLTVAGVETATVAASPASAQEDLSALGPMDRVVVTGARREELQSEAVIRTEAIDRDEIERSGAEHLGEVLDGHPGVRITQGFAGQGIEIRGLDTRHTLILIDGQRLNGRVDGTLDLQRIAAERIERVEIVRGPSSALYGSDALGGVINIITKQPRAGVQGSAHLAVGTLEDPSSGLFDPAGPGTVDLSGRVAGSSGMWNGSFSGGFHHQSAFDLDPSDEATSGSELRSFNLETNHELTLSPRVALTVRGDVFRRELNALEIGPELAFDTDQPFRDSRTRAQFDRRNETTTFSLAAGPRVDLAPGHQLQVTTTFSRFEDVFFRSRQNDVEAPTLQTTTDDLGLLTAQYDGELSSRHLLTVGTEAMVEAISSPRLRTGQGTRGRFSAYAQHEWRPIDALSIVPGIRLDMDSQFGVFPAPKIAARWDVIETLTLRASYGLGFRAPAVRELFLLFENPGAGYLIDGNPDLQPETSRGATAGAELRIPKLLRGSTFFVELYRNDVDDLIVFLPAGVETEQGLVFTNDNVDAAVTQGVEVEWSVNWTQFLQTSVGYAYLDARDINRDRGLPGRSDHRVTFRAALESRNLGLTAWARGAWASSAPLFIDGEGDAFTTLRIPEFVSLDARIEKDLGDHAAVFVGGENLANAGDPVTLPILPRSVFAGLNGSY